MKIFKLKKGGQTENVKETIVVLNRNIDDDLIIKAINNAAGDNEDTTEGEVLKYLEDNFKAIYEVENNLETFYY